MFHDARNTVASWRYAGTRYQCPICEHRWRRLAPGQDGSPDAVCPRCWSSERNRVLWLYLQREEHITGARILHFAPERGISRRLRTSHAGYLSADVDPGAADTVADITDLPFNDATFDLVLCSHVLEHVPEDRQAMRELHRVLAPAGVALLQHPVDTTRTTTYEDPSITDPAARLRAFGQDDHVRIYGRDLQDRLTDAGFAVQVIPYREHLPSAERDRYRLDRRSTAVGDADAIYRCTRSDGHAATMLNSAPR